MKRNVGTKDRVLRVVGAIAMGAAGALGPGPLGLRLGAFGGLAVYLVVTAVAGTCLGYTLMGRSTCPVKAVE